MYARYPKGSKISPFLAETYAKRGRPDFIHGVELTDLTMELNFMRPLSSLDQIIEPESPE